LGGEIITSPNTKISFFAQTNTNRLTLSNTVEAEVQEVNPTLGRTAVRSICGCMMFEGDDALKKISVLSGGERSRVLLGKILATPSNLLLLDEPTNHLDVESVMALTDALEVFEGAVVIVTHNEDILRRTAQRLIVYQGEKPFLFEGGYDDFLDMVGWEEEADLVPKGKRKGGPSAGTARDKKKGRADLVQERSRVVTPLKTQVERSEKRIEELEKTVENLQQKLAAVSGHGDAVGIKLTSQELAVTRQDLEKEVGRWEESSQELERQEKNYAAKMQEVEA
jgi:ATP-binding cassette subfamily F protein 3